MSDAKQNLNAILIHKALKRAPATKADLCDSLGLEPAEFDAAVRYSRRSNDPAKTTANEIIGVTRGKTHLYYLCKTADQADQYMGKRYAIVQGHFESIQVLLNKEMEKFPDHAREVQLAIRTVERAQQDLEALLG